jgi:ectoine hydroxylase-related dioxygenase (phytanoyl-CoA dioxygenase family)
MDKAKRTRLLTDGFCQAPAVLSDDMLRRLRAATDLMLDKQTEEHKGYNELHDLIAEPHSEELGQATDLDRAEFKPRPDEVDVPVRAGDLVIGDARLLHAAHPNRSDQRRTVLTLWYQPDYPALPERVQAQMVAKTQPLSEARSAEGRELAVRLHPVYEADAEPHGRMLRPRLSA